MRFASTSACAPSPASSRSPGRAEAGSSGPARTSLWPGVGRAVSCSDRSPSSGCRSSRCMLPLRLHSVSPCRMRNARRSNTCFSSSVARTTDESSRGGAPFLGVFKVMSGSPFFGNAGTSSSHLSPAEYLLRALVVPAGATRVGRRAVFFFDKSLHHREPADEWGRLSPEDFLEYPDGAPDIRHRFRRRHGPSKAAQPLIDERTDMETTATSTAGTRSDAFVLFGVTGDLAYKKIFPALQAMASAATSTFPSSVWPIGLDPGPVPGAGKGQRDRTRRPRCGRVRATGGTAPLCGRRLPRSQTFAQLRAELTACNASHALPRDSSEHVPDRGGAAETAGCTRRARVIVEKPFGRDLRSARELNSSCHDVSRARHFSNRPLPWEGGRSEHPVLPLRQCVSRADVEPSLRRERADHDGREFGVKGRGKLYDETGVIRDVIQNHLLQIVTYLAMEAPSSMYPEAVRDEQAKVLRTIRPMNAERHDFAVSSAAIGTSRTCRRTRRCRPTRRSGSTSTRGAGRACPSTCARASASR